MELIHQWLAGSKNFIVGRTLYKKYGKDKNLINLFDKGTTSFSKQKLEEALTALATQPEQKKLLCENTKEARLFTPMPSAADGVLKALQAEYQPYYQRMNVLRHKLDEYGKDNSLKARTDCKLLCDEILELEQKCMVIWEKHDYYLVEGKLPDVKTEAVKVPDNLVQMGKKMEALKRNIRRNKDKARKYPDNAEYAMNVKKYEEQILHLTKTGKE